jgi:hypothetical protein
MYQQPHGLPPLVFGDGLRVLRDILGEHVDALPCCSTHLGRSVEHSSYRVTSGFAMRLETAPRHIESLASGWEIRGVTYPHTGSGAYQILWGASAS